MDRFNVVSEALFHIVKSREKNKDQQTFNETYKSLRCTVKPLFIVSEGLSGQVQGGNDKHDKMMVA
jgi:hypothetical protein